jgi:membrane peptidoglycan carboxypeptidase
VAGRTIEDVHPKDSVLSLADALRVSSNVGVSMVAVRLTPDQEYAGLRDFGFGTPTALGIPGESSGMLRRPDRWSRQSAVSLAIGYEVSVTPLQLVTAYGALANGGLLMQPRLVRRVLDADGNVIEEPEPRVVRRVVSERTATAVAEVLESVVEDGTGTAVRMRTFRVAGKSGTSQIANPRGGYLRGQYYSSFVGFFPADDPQLVVLVKLQNAQGAYYGGAIAAPVTRETLEAILAARRSPLDLRAVAKVARGETRGGTGSVIRSGVTGSSEGLALRFASLSTMVAPELPAPVIDFVAPAEGSENLVPVPNVAGLPVRTAVRRLHALGLRVERDGTGDVVRISPPSGTRVAAGDTVVLRTGATAGGTRRE